MKPKPAKTDTRTTVLIVGGGTGGVAAALALAKRGVACVMTEPTAWVGGQLTAQGVPPDENKWIESADFRAAPESYLDLRRQVRASVARDSALRPAFRTAPHLNPGGGWVSRLCAEPDRIHTVLTQLLAPHIAAGLIDLRPHTEPISATTSGPGGDGRVSSVTFFDHQADSTFTVEAELVLDATETGDLWELAGIGHTIGAESRAVYNELHGRTDLHADQATDALDQQAISWCFALTHDPDRSNVGDEPEGYAFWRSHIPETEPAWPGPFFSWAVPTHNEEGVRRFGLVPWPSEPEKNQWELWRYRRLVDAAKWTDSRPDVTLMNCVQIDYWLKPVLGVTREARAEAIAGAQQLSRCFLHWMRTEAPRHDTEDRRGYPGLRLHAPHLGSARTDAPGFALTPYIREPRRLLARTMLTEAHVGTDQRREAGEPNQYATEFGAGEPFDDSVAIGHYPIDLHPSCSGRNSVYVPACPFRVPMGALIPRGSTNTLAAGKALGVSHVANGSTRLHPVEWAIGEAAGAIAAHCVSEGVSPHEAHETLARVRTIQHDLSEHGAPIDWPWEAAPGSANPVAQPAKPSP